MTESKNQLITLYTQWGEQLDRENVLPEYPRPQFQRNSYLNLNGVWKYAIRDSGDEPSEYDGDIVVPFSPEAPLSGVNKQLKQKQFLWYKRSFDLSGLANAGRMLLHFGAVDQTCEVFVGEQKVGEHDGGYTPFFFDITEAYGQVEDKKSVVIKVRVQDNLTDNGAAYGKQSASRGGIWYTATSGIWQTVWIESVPETYLQRVLITPNYDEETVELLPEVTGSAAQTVEGVATVYDANKNKIGESPIKDGVKCSIKITDMHSWSPEDPYLYTIHYTLGSDSVDSYFGMRKFSVDVDSNGIKRLFLNNRPYFHNGLLDQGYWSDGYYTAPSDEANIYDITTMKRLGFNMLRKHIKIEPLRWYYHCDRIGMLVWQDAVSGGYPYHMTVTTVLPFIGVDLSDKHYTLFGRTSQLGKDNYYRDLRIMINHLYNCPCISTWVPFNEGWGQFDSLDVTKAIREMDTTRFVDHASGWHDQGGGDFRSLHVYYKKVRISADKHNRTIVLSEFGGYSHGVENHVGSTAQFGYAKYSTVEALNKAIKELYEEQIIPLIPRGLSATVYTQVSDVEDEVNGLLTYDRKVIKADQDTFKQINDQLHL